MDRKEHWSDEALDRALADLYTAPVPESFGPGWRAAIQREENAQMKQKSMFWKVALPIAAPGIVSLVILQFFENWNLVEPGLIFLRDKQKWPLSLYLTTIGQSNADVAMASSIITIIPAILIFLYGETYLLQGIRVSGLKE